MSGKFPWGRSNPNLLQSCTHSSYKEAFAQQQTGQNTSICHCTMHTQTKWYIQGQLTATATVRNIQVSQCHRRGLGLSDKLKHTQG